MVAAARERFGAPRRGLGQRRLRGGARLRAGEPRALALDGADERPRRRVTRSAPRCPAIRESTGHVILTSSVAGRRVAARLAVLRARSSPSPRWARACARSSTARVPRDRDRARHGRHAVLRQPAVDRGAATPRTSPPRSCGRSRSPRGWTSTRSCCARPRRTAERGQLSALSAARPRGAGPRPRRPPRARRRPSPWPGSPRGRARSRWRPRRRRARRRARGRAPRRGRRAPQQQQPEGEVADPEPAQRGPAARRAGGRAEPRAAEALGRQHEAGAQRGAPEGVGAGLGGGGHGRRRGPRPPRRTRGRARRSTTRPRRPSVNSSTPAERA